MVYLFLACLLFLLIYHYDYCNHKRGRKGWYLFVMIYMILVAGLRYRIGGDTVNYAMNHYNVYPDLMGYWDIDFSNERYGRGYLFLTAIARSISDNFWAMQMILAILLNCVVFRFFYRNTEKIFTAVILYFILCYFQLNMEVLREACAVAFFLLGWEYFYKHKWIKYYVLCGIALLFHMSAAVTLILPLFTLKIFKKIFSVSKLGVIIAFSLFFLGIYITSRFFDVIRLIGMATIDSYADSYENSSFAEARGFNIVGSTVFIMRTLAYPLICGWLIAKGKVSNSKTTNPKYKAALMIMLMSYIYISAVSASMVILSRFTNYLVMFMIIVISDALFHKIQWNRSRYRLSFTVWCIAIIPFCIIPIKGLFEPSGRAMTPPIHRYYPYYSVFNPQLDRERENIIKYTYFPDN